jgi:hypothetical protein
MKIGTIFLSFILILSSCTSQKAPSYNIDFIAYNWSRQNDTTRTQSPIFLKCRIYSNINESGLADIYYYRGYPQPKSYLFSASIKKSLIDHLVNASNSTDSIKLHVFDSIPLIYDGPALKIRIRSAGQKDKLIEFINLKYGNEVDTLRKLYYQIDSIFSRNTQEIINNKFKQINDTLEFKKQKTDFINFVIRHDTIRYPLIMRTPPYE